jgi:hypothetical protein
MRSAYLELGARATIVATRPLSAVLIALFAQACSRGVAVSIAAPPLCADAEIRVDGSEVGRLRDVQTGCIATVMVPHGSHVLEIRYGEKLLHSEQLKFAESEREAYVDCCHIVDRPAR